MSAVWISKESWQKIWSALHNIRIRQSFAVKTPSATLSGQGSSARINIDLPAASAGGESGVCLAKIAGCSGNMVYDVLLYENGLDSDYTGKGTLATTQLALSSKLPTGTVVIAYKNLVRIVGGSD